MAAKLRNRLLPLMFEKEQREGRRITYTEIAEATASSVNVISRWANNDIERLDASILVKLCEYFECEVGDLLYLDQHETQTS